jgi:pimeloyl-ACP methyl ester carboxylesterase
VAERRDIDRQSLRPVGDVFDWPWQPGRFPRGKRQQRTPFNLNLERESGELARRMPEIGHPHRVLWGEKDGWIAPADLKTMAAAMPDCR